MRKRCKKFFDLPIDVDYYKPMRTHSACNSNYIEYESKEDKIKTLSIKKYLDIIRPYLSDTINNHKTQREWKFQVSTTFNIISSQDSDESRIMHTKSDNKEIMIGNETSEIIEKVFESLLQKYKQDVEESMRGMNLLLIVLIYCTINLMK